MTLDHMIEVPADKLKELISATYELSEPVNMGFLHYRPGPLDPDDAQALLEHAKDQYKEGQYHDDDKLAAFLSMDYVHGRCCKMVVFKMKGAERYFIRKKWFDHTPRQLQQLLDRLGVNHEVEEYDQPEYRQAK